MKQLFVSYASENKATVDELVRRFPRLGYQAWIDSTLHGGQSWWDEIVRQIANCDVFVVVVSSGSLKSVACARELKWALDLGKPVLPVAIETRDGLVNALPPELASVQLVDWTAPSPDSAIELAGALMALPPAPALPEVLPDPPPPPLSYLNDIAEQVSQDVPLTAEQQRAIVVRLQPGLDSADPAENKAATFLLDKLSRRDDLYSDVDRMLRALMPAGVAAAGPTTSGVAAAPPVTGPEAPKYPAAKRLSRPLVLALVAVVLVASGVGLVLKLRCEIRPDRCQRAAGTLQPPIALPGTPNGLARGGDHLWVTTEQGSLLRIDPAERKSDLTFKIDGKLKGLAAGRDRVWVWNDETVIPVDFSGNPYQPLKTGPQKITGIAAGESDVWAALDDRSVVHLSDSGPAVPVFSGGKADLGIAYAGGKLWVVDPGASKVHQIDPRNNASTDKTEPPIDEPTEKSVPTPKAPVFPKGASMTVDTPTGSIEAAGDTVYVATGDGKSVTPIGAQTYVVLGEPIPFGSGSVYAGDGQGIWVASSLEKGKGELRYVADKLGQSRGAPIDLKDVEVVDMLADDEKLWLLGKTPGGELIEVIPNELKRQTG